MRAHPFEIIQSDEFWRESTVDTQELLVHHSCEREIAERVHAGVVDRLGILVFTWLSAGGGSRSETEN